MGQALSHAPCILTIRDPRDSVCSLMDQFGWSFDDALGYVAPSATALDERPTDGELFLRYKDHEARPRAWCMAIARYLDLSLDEETAGHVTQELESEEVRRFIGAWVRDEGLDAVDPRGTFHQETHWHPNHIGNGEIGKHHKRLTSEQAALVHQRTEAFCGAHGYAATPQG